MDYSTLAVDVVLLDDDSDQGEWRHYSLATKPKDSLLAARRVRDAMPPRSLWRDLGVWLVGIEKPYSRSRQTLAALMRIQGAVLACLPADVAVFELAANEWQPFFCGHAMAPRSVDRKLQIRSACFLREFAPNRHLFPSRDDACDAYGLAWTVREKWELGRVEVA